MEEGREQAPVEGGGQIFKGGSVCAQAKKIPVPGWLGAPTEKPMALMEG